MREKILSVAKKAGGVQNIDIWKADILKLEMKNYLWIDNRQDIIDCALVEFYTEMNLAS
jgi:hypothetical protein